MNNKRCVVVQKAAIGSYSNKVSYMYVLFLHVTYWFLGNLGLPGILLIVVGHLEFLKISGDVC